MAPNGGRGAGSGLVCSPSRGGNVSGARYIEHPLIRSSLIFKNTCLAFYKLVLTLRIVFLLGDHRCLSHVVVKEEK